MADFFDSPFGEIGLGDTEFSSWDLDTDPLGLDDDGPPPIMTMPGDCQNGQVMQVSLAPADQGGSPSPLVPDTPGTLSNNDNSPAPGSNDKARRITVWNRTTKRKVSGNAAPMEKNLSEYLRKHPDCELYTGQDRFLTTEEKQSLIAEQNRIPIWNKLEQRKISGNAAPSEKNLAEYLRNRPHCEVYAGQDKPPGTWTKPEATPPRPRSSARASAQQQQTTQQSDLSPDLHHLNKTPELPIPKNTSLSDVFQHRNDGNDMYTGIGSDIPFKPDESEVFSMSGLADSLSLDDHFGTGFMDMCGTGSSVPELGGMAASPAQRILNDREMRANQAHMAGVSMGTRPRGFSGNGMSADVMGMSFSYRDLLGMSAGTPTPGANQMAHDFLDLGIGADL